MRDITVKLVSHGAMFTKADKGDTIIIMPRGDDTEKSEMSSKENDINVLKSVPKIKFNKENKTDINYIKNVLNYNPKRTQK